MCYLQCNKAQRHELNIVMLNVASDRFSTYQCSGQGGDSLSAFIGLNDAESDGTITHPPQPQAAGSAAGQQQLGQGASTPKCVPILKPDTYLKNNLPSAAPLDVPVSYSSSGDMFCHILPTHLTGIHYPLIPVLLPLMYTGSTPSQIPSSQAQRPNDTSLDAAFLQANTPYFLGPGPVSTHTPLSSLPVLPTHGLYFPCDNDFSLVQNSKPEAHGSILPAAERYTNQGVLLTFTALRLHVLQF